MTAENRGGNRLFRSVLLAGSGLGMLQAHSAYADDPKTEAPADRGAVPEIYVLGQRDSYTVGATSVCSLRRHCR